MKTCARCKGRFPEPGVEKNGKIYCCDKCAGGPGRMMLKAVPAVLGVFGLGFFTGYLIRRE